MPPKTQKQKEEEAARLAEEQRLKEEEEERQKKEQEKYLITRLSQTKYNKNQQVCQCRLLNIILKQYILMKSHIKQQFNIYQEQKNLNMKLAEINNCKTQLRDIDIQITADQLITDLVFAKQLQMNPEAVQVLINIFFLVFTHNNKKFSEPLRFSNSLSIKDKVGDEVMFNQLIKAHAECGYFKPSHMKLIMEYFKSYTNHIDLVNYAFQIDQRPLELHLDLQIDLPLMFPPLDDAMIYRQQEQKVEDEQEIENINIEDQQVPVEPTDEELLDSLILEAIQKKLESAKEELEEKLEARKMEIESKLMSLTAKKK